MKKSTIFIILLFLSSFLLRLSLSFLSPVKYWDETIYSNLGRNILLYHEYSFLHGFADFSPNWPLAGFRPPLLPLIISLVSLFSFDSFYLNFIAPFFSSLGVIGFFLLTKKMFNEKIAVYSSLMFSLTPLNLFWGSKILTDGLFLTMIIFSMYFFWNSFEEKSREIHSALFGVFSALAFLSRYSMIWFFPVFFVYLIFKHKSLNFLFRKRFLISCASFLIIVAPWFLYNYFDSGSFFGFLTQANEAALRWGSQPFFFYFIFLIKTFWIFLPFFFLGILSYRSEDYRKPLFLTLTWFVVILLSASFMPHKEERYILPVLPALCAISSLGIYKIKKYGFLIFFLITCFLLAGNLHKFYEPYANLNSQERQCFFQTMDFMKDSGASYVVTEHFSPVYFYTLKKNIRVNNYTEIYNLIRDNHKNEAIYYYYVDGDWFNLVSENESIKNNEIYTCRSHHVFILD